MWLGPDTPGQQLTDNQGPAPVSTAGCSTNVSTMYT